MKGAKRLWIALIALAVLSPVGILLPAKYGTGGAWGEWSCDHLKDSVGYVPAGMAGLTGLWRAPAPDYALLARQGATSGLLAGSYVLSAFVGIVAVCLLAFGLGRLLRKNEESDAT